MPRYILEDNLSELVVADVEADDPMTAYRMAPDPLEPGEEPTHIAESDDTRLWYGYRVYAARPGMPNLMGMDPDCRFAVWDRESYSCPLVARIGALDEEGW